MIDQAAELRRLVNHTAHAVVGEADAPRTLVVAGGRPGVGVTRLAAELSFALASDAQRVVLADADLCRADLAARYGASEVLTLADVLAGKRGIHEILQRGPGGIQLLAGTRSTETRAALSERQVRRFCQQLRSLGKHADWVIIDAGSEANELTTRLAALADHLWVITSPDAVAVMDTYALVKTLLSRQRLIRPIDLIVTGADQPLAADVHRRVDQSCRRFLGLPVKLAGWMPHRASRTGGGPVADGNDSLDTDSIGPLLQYLTGGPAASGRRIAHAA